MLQINSRELSVGVTILLVYVQCVGSSPSVISNNSAIVNAKHMTKLKACSVLTLRL